MNRVTPEQALFQRYNLSTVQRTRCGHINVIDFVAIMTYNQNQKKEKKQCCQS